MRSQFGPYESAGIDTRRDNSHTGKKPLAGTANTVISRRVLLILVTAACVLPVAIIVVVAAGWLLAAMGDQRGATGLNRTALVLGIVWIVDLVCLLVAQAVHTLDPPDDRS